MAEQTPIVQVAPKNSAAGKGQDQADPPAQKTSEPFKKSSV
jgi:hypothetical protein